MGSDPSRDNDGVRKDDSRFHRGSDPIFLFLCASVSPWFLPISETEPQLGLELPMQIGLGISALNHPEVCCIDIHHCAVRRG